MPLSDNLRGALLMNGSMLAFTLNDTAMKAVTKTLPLPEAITLRGVLAVVALLIIGVVLGQLKLRLSVRDAGLVLLRSAAEMASTVLFLAALMQMPLANLSAIMQFLPLAVTLAAALVFRETIGWRRMVAILVGLVGVLIIIRPGPAGFDAASLMGLGSVAGVVVRDLATRRMSREVPSVTVALAAAVSVLLLGAVWTEATGWQGVTGREGLLILGAAGGLIVGYLCAVATMRVGDIAVIAPFRYSALLWAILLGWIGFGTLPDGWTLVGAGLVVASGLFTFWRERKLRAAKP